MTLNDYLKEKQLSDTAFAKEIGVPYAIYVSRYRKGQIIPRPAIMKAIYKATNKQVLPNSFYTFLGQ